MTTATATRRARRHGFRRRDARAVHDLHFGPNMTPMVDVVLVILIFFMAGAALLGPELLLRAGIAAEPQEQSVIEALTSEPTPQSPFALTPPTLPVRVTIDDAGTPRCTGFGVASLPLAECAARAEEVANEMRDTGAITGDPQSDVAVALEVAPGAPYGAAVQVHDALTRAGFTRVGLR